MAFVLRAVVAGWVLLGAAQGWGQGGANPGIYAMAGVASTMFDRCGMAELGERLREVLGALAEECGVVEAARAEFERAVTAGLEAARGASAQEVSACRDRLHYDPSLPALLERLTAFEARRMPASEALPLSCARVVPPR